MRKITEEELNTLRNELSELRTNGKLARLKKVYELIIANDDNDEDLPEESWYNQALTFIKNYEIDPSKVNELVFDNATAQMVSNLGTEAFIHCK